MSTRYVLNKEEAYRSLQYTRRAQVELETLLQQMRFQNLSQGRRYIILHDGTTIECVSKFGQSNVYINPPPKHIQVEKEELVTYETCDWYLIIYYGYYLVYDPISNVMTKLDTTQQQFLGSNFSGGLYPISAYSFNMVSCSCNEFPGYNWEISVGKFAYNMDRANSRINLKLISNGTKQVAVELYLLDEYRRGYRLVINSTAKTITFYQAWTYGNIYAVITTVIGYVNKVPAVVSTSTTYIDQDDYYRLNYYDGADFQYRHYLDPITRLWSSSNYDCPGTHDNFFFPIADIPVWTWWEGRWHWTIEYGWVWMSGMWVSPPDDPPYASYALLGDAYPSYYNDIWIVPDCMHTDAVIFTGVMNPLDTQVPGTPENPPYEEQPQYYNVATLHCGYSQQAYTYYADYKNPPRIDPTGNVNNLPIFNFYNGKGPGGELLIIARMQSGGGTDEVSANGNYKLSSFAPVPAYVQAHCGMSGTHMTYDGTETGTVITSFPNKSMQVFSMNANNTISLNEGIYHSTAAGINTGLAMINRWSYVPDTGHKELKIYFTRVREKVIDGYEDYTEKFEAAFNKAMLGITTFDPAKLVGICLYSTGILT